MMPIQLTARTSTYDSAKPLVRPCLSDIADNDDIDKKAKSEAKSLATRAKSPDQECEAFASQNKKCAHLRHNLRLCRQTEQ